jgi:hypothetical protein
MLEKDHFKLLAGFDKPTKLGDYLSCKETKIDKIKILKRGKAFNSYRESSGSYLNSWFTVKFIAEGSCKLSYPAEVDGKSISKYYRIREIKHAVEKSIKGRVPLRPIPIEATITTDNYGDWVAANIRPKVSKYGSEEKAQRKKYRQQLYIQLNQGLLYERGDSFHHIPGYYFTEGSLPASKNTSTKKTLNNRPSKEHPYQLTKNDNKLIDEMASFFKSNPRALKLFTAKSQAVQWQLYQRISKRKTKQQRYQTFLQVANELQHPKTRRVTSSNKHSHGGRYHSHRLPAQGKAHRHGNGALGR